MPISSSSQRLIIKWSGQELSTISVIQPETPLCKTQVVTHQPAASHFIPPRVDGANESQQAGLIGDILPGTSKGSDADFKGHGPDVNARVRLINNGTSVSAELFMSARETQADWTRAEGSRTDQLEESRPHRPGDARAIGSRAALTRRARFRRAPSPGIE